MRKLTMGKLLFGTALAIGIAAVPGCGQVGSTGTGHADRNDPYRSPDRAPSNAEQGNPPGSNPSSSAVPAGAPARPPSGGVNPGTDRNLENGKPPIPGPDTTNPAAPPRQGPNPGTDSH